MTPRMRATLEVLLEAYAYAQDLQRDPWDLAIEIQSFQTAGCTTAVLRWLICQGYLEHGVEVCRSRMEGRAFRRDPGLHFTGESCFVLTEAGNRFAVEFCAGAGEPPTE